MRTAPSPALERFFGWPLLADCCQSAATIRYLCYLPTTTMLKVTFLKLTLSCLGLAALTGCALFPSWHWEKKGASEAEYSFDEAQCKAKVYSGTDGMVTNASVRRMHGCMEAKGWVKVPN